MMGQNSGNQNRLFYSFNLDDHVPASHLLRGINQFFDFTDLRAYLAPFYSHTGRPSIDPELMIRMLIIRLLFWDSLGAAAVRRSAPELSLSLVLSVRDRGRGAGALDVLEEPAWPLSRERCIPPCV